MDKQTLRAEIKRRHKECLPEERHQWSKEICEHLCTMEALINSSVVMAFYPLDDEVDILPLLRHLHEKGKTILLPEVTSKTSMVLRHYSPEAEMISGALGTQVPKTSIYTDYSKIDTVLVPGVAFDKQGHRMGRGKGYYDRFLQMLPEKSIKIGVCFPYQIVEYVPTEEHDVMMDYV